MLIKSQFVMYQCIRLEKLYKLIESFFKISISFSNYWPIIKKYSNRVNIDRSAMYHYQWISLDKLYKLMENFFQILESFLELVTIV